MKKELLNSQTYESAIGELEEIITQMESGNLPLENTLTAYKRGFELIKICQNKLTEVEEQVKLFNEKESLDNF